MSELIEQTYRDLAYIQNKCRNLAVQVRDRELSPPS